MTVICGEGWQGSSFPTRSSLLLDTELLCCEEQKFHLVLVFSSIWSVVRQIAC